MQNARCGRGLDLEPCVAGRGEAPDGGLGALEGPRRLPELHVGRALEEGHRGGGRAARAELEQRQRAHRPGRGGGRGIG